MWTVIDRDEFMKLRNRCPTFKRFDDVVIWYIGKAVIPYLTYNERTKTYKKWSY
jgi:hypothetical protein